MNIIRRLVGYLVLVLQTAFVIGILCGDALAAPVSFKPMTVTQPDGTQVDLYISGDEFYRYLHDENGYPVVRDDDGWLVYVQERGEQPVLSTLRAGVDDPFLYGIWINPGPPDLPIVVAEKVSSNRRLYARPQVLAPRIGGPYRGTINELVIFVRFDGEPEFTDQISYFDNVFNNVEEGAVSLRSYYKEVSYGKMEVQAHFFPQPTGDTVLSYQDSHPRGYFRKYSDRNHDGYQYEQEGMYRLGDMLERAIAYVKPQISSDLDLDLDDNGIAENVTFIVSGNADDWADALWPHSYMLLGSPYINDVMLMEYNLQFRDWLQDEPVGVLAHEFFHAIGAPDLYHYERNGISPAGPWDLMEWDGNPPQHMTAHMKFNYGRWIDEIPTITTAGRYTLNPLVSPTNNSFRIPVPGSKYESFVVEYRKKEGTYESSIPGSGLLIYRTDRRQGGNADGPPDELFVMRPDGEPLRDGSIVDAFYSADVGRTEFSESTIPWPFMQDGSPAAIRIYDISAAGDTISFNVCPSIPSCLGIECGDDGCGGSCGQCDDNNDCTVDSCEAGVCMNVPVMDGVACGQDYECMVGGVCANGGCVASVPAECHDDSDCTVDSCFDGQKWVDVNEDRFEDILNGGTSAAIDGDDVASGVIPIGFDFPFMGNVMNSLTVYDNGFITLGGFVDPVQNTVNIEIPSALAPENMIAAYWDDLVCKLSDRCVIGYATLGESPNRRTIIQWNKVAKVGIPKARISMQIALFEDGRIELRYKEPGGLEGVSATIGLQGAGGAAGYQYSAFKPVLRRGMTLAWSPAGYQCRFLPVTGHCLIDGNCVEKGALDPANSCVQCMPLSNGTGWTSDDTNTCSDESLCTRSDVCRAGVCEGGDRIICGALDQCHLAGGCDPSTGLCDNPTKPDGMTCDADSSGCTKGDTCRQGVCEAGVPVDCSGFNVPCGVGVCVSRGASSYRCETDKALAVGMACGRGPAMCRGQDTCDETGKCVVNNDPVDTVCRPAFNQCDIPELCDGEGTCPADQIGPDWSACGTSGLDAVCLGGACVASVPGDTCADAIEVVENEPYEGDLATAHQYASSSAGCPEISGPDMFFKFVAAAGVEYRVVVIPQERADLALALSDACTSDSFECESVTNKAEAGAGESFVVSYPAETAVYFRVVKLGNSLAAGFRITVLPAGASVDNDAQEADSDVDGGDEIVVVDSGAGCSQTSGHGSAPSIIMIAFVVGMFGMFRRIARRRLL